MNRLKNSDEENDGGGGAQRAKRVVLLGHSMGCASTLKMALTLPADVEKTIVLIAPALVGDLPDKDGGSSSSTAAVKSNSPVDGGAEVNKSIKGIIRNQPANIKKWVGIFIAVLRRVILDPVIVYILKRAVG
jgi:pimeloyl-ACP methyl ester carboxylesterase